MHDSTIDLLHVGRERYVAAHVIRTADGPVLVDCGPGSTVENLRAGLAAIGLRIPDLRAVLLSHIHFDHAGAVGHLVAENSRLTVYVHERGAPHLVDPTRLLASATQVFGDKMEYLWGTLLPTPGDRIQALRGGETLSFGDRHFEVLYTPGHANHHVAYLERADDTAYVGDVGGIRAPLLPWPLPVTPPPDFDLEKWLASVDLIEAWRPRRLFSTHFGFWEDVANQLTVLRQGLEDWTTTAKRLLDAPGTDAERAVAFDQHVIASLDGKGPAEAIAKTAAFSDYRASWYGLARYHRKKGAPA